MYQRPYHILVAEDHALTRHEVVSVLQRRDYSVLSVANALEVADTLKRWPVDLLITGTRMGSWFGIQIILTSRATQPDLAAILVSESDGHTELIDAGRHNIAVVSRPFLPEEFLALVAERLATIRRRQRWPRKPVTSEVGVSISGQRGRLVDVSYGGCKVQVAGEHVLSPTMRMTVPVPRLELDTELIWSALSDDGATCVAGVSVQEAGSDGSWRRFVDHVS
jgi:DNA-binding NtrC family response regulator